MAVGRLILCGLGIVLATQTHLAAADTVTLTTLEWPPYTSTELPQGGATTHVVQMVFEKAGIHTTVKTLPWKRAIADAKNTATSVAYFPGYHCHHVDGFIASDPIGFGPLGFVEHAEAPIVWSSLDDIGEQKLSIGTVLGYANTEEFDEKAGTGWIKAVPAKDDATNLRKLVRQRIDAAVIDKLVLSYLLATEPNLAGARDVLQFDERPLEGKTLYLCFFDDDVGRAMRDRFNAGLAQLDLDAVVDAYFQQEF